MISKELFASCTEGRGLALPPDAFERFDIYARLLAEYNEKVNLTAITAPDEIVVKHFCDSLCLLQYVQPPQSAAVCDVGTGAGFPGMCLKLARPDLRLTLFDSVNKKLDFLRFLCAELGTEATIVHIRAEAAGRDPAFRERFDLVTARAVASLERLSEYCVPLARVGGLFAPLKAPVSPEEKTAGCAAAKTLGAERTQDRFYELPTGERREIIVFQKKSQTSPKYPRSAAQIAKNPLK